MPVCPQMTEGQLPERLTAFKQVTACLVMLFRQSAAVALTTYCETSQPVA